MLRVSSLTELHICYCVIHNTYTYSVIPIQMIGKSNVPSSGCCLADLQVFICLGFQFPPPPPPPPFLFTMVLNRIAFHCSALRGMGCGGYVYVRTRVHVHACMCMFAGGGGGYASFLFSGSFHNTDLAKIRKSTMCSFKTSVLFFFLFCYT